MDFGSILELLGCALGGGGVATVINWRLNKRKMSAEVKQDEIEVIRKTIEDAYKPTIEHLETQVDKLYKQVNFLENKVDKLTKERDDCKNALAALTSKVDGLERKRDNRGRYAPQHKKEKDAATC